jgi:very-short-patch-repair endonuclease
MRSLYFTAAESGLTRGQLRWGEAQGRWRRVARSTYRYGPEDPSVFDRAMGLVLAEGGLASGHLAGALHGFDAIRQVTPEVTVSPVEAHKRSRVRRRQDAAADACEVAGVPCTSPIQTLVDLAASLGDDAWEQALESALRKHPLTVEDLVDRLPELSRARTPGVVRIRRVLGRRPPGAPPTESVLETMFLQLARRVRNLGDPVRQLIVNDRDGQFIARVDFAWPELGLFIELDGMHHAGQPVYDARRETAVIAATGWLVGRFTWDEVVRNPVATSRRLEALVQQARRRRLPAPTR